MINVLDHQLQLFDRDARSEAWRDETGFAVHCLELDKIIAFGIFVLDQIDRSATHHDSGLPQITARAMVPLYALWHRAAGDILKVARDFKKRGFVPRQLREFAHAYNHSKVWVEFDQTVNSFQSIQRGERGRTLEEIVDELQGDDRHAS